LLSQTIECRRYQLSRRATQAQFALQLEPTVLAPSEQIHGHPPRRDGVIQ
jgi:hypothetical protein